MKIILDALGGDHAPGAVVQGALAFLRARADVHIVFTGPENVLQSLLEKEADVAGRYTIVHAPEQISMDEPPVLAIKRKRNSSLVVGLELLKSKAGDAFVTCGSTGATLSGALLRVGRIRGVSRPALAPILPSKTGKGVMLIDCGANMDCKPQNLAQFALMGDLYMRHIVKIEKPRVGLASVGTEDEKGNELTHAAFPLIKELPGLNFVGNIEGRDLFDVDVCVADGFAGNLLLKSVEGTAKYLLGMIKTEVTASFSRKIGALLLKPAFKAIKNKMDYAEYGGAPLLGIDGVVLKGHGSSNARAVECTLRQAADMVSADVVSRIRTEIEATLTE